MNNISPENALTLLNAQQARAPSLPKPANVENEENLNSVAREFEAVFLSEMIKPMFEGIETSDSMFGGGKGEEIFQGMMITEYGKAMAEKDITGIQTQVKNKLIEMQAARTAYEQDAPTEAIRAGIIQDLEIIEHTTQDEAL